MPPGYAEIVTTIRTDRAHAEELDAADPLAGFRDRFVRDDKSLIYLDGNSLGPLPVATEARIAEVVRQEWGGGLVRSWPRWIELPRRAGDLVGQHLVGAAPGQVAVCDSTTINLYKLAAAKAPGIVPVTSGNNTVTFVQNGKTTTIEGFNAQAGYSLVDGVGTVNGWYLAYELAGKTPPT